MNAVSAQKPPALLQKWRWWIAGLLAAATALNYLDRQNLPVVVVELQKHIPLTNQQYARLQFLFLMAYGLMYVGGGRIVDWLGTRLGYAVMILWWSAANFLHGTANGVFSLGVYRFLLGMGEGGGFPGSAKAVSEWFPAEERSLAFGIFNTGSSLGAIIAPPLIALIVSLSSWRWVFFITGTLGFLWTWIWLRVYYTPDADPSVIASHNSVTTAPVSPVRIRWVELFRYQQVWGLISAKFLSDSAWYFFIFWLPKYLADVRKLNIREIGYYAWIPYAFAAAGSFVGGWLSSHLIQRGFSVDRSRKISLGLSAALMPASLLIATSSLRFAILFFSLALFGHQFWSTIMQTLPADMFPPRIVASVAGLLGAAGSFGGMFFNYLVGQILGASHSYSPVFLISGLLHPAAFLIVLFAVKRIDQVA